MTWLADLWFRVRVALRRDSGWIEWRYSTSVLTDDEVRSLLVLDAAVEMERLP